MNKPLTNWKKPDKMILSTEFETLQSCLLQSLLVIVVFILKFDLDIMMVDLSAYEVSLKDDNFIELFDIFKNRLYASVILPLVFKMVIDGI